VNFSFIGKQLFDFYLWKVSLLQIVIANKQYVMIKLSAFSPNSLDKPKVKSHADD